MFRGGKRDQFTYPTPLEKGYNKNHVDFLRFSLKRMFFSLFHKKIDLSTEDRGPSFRFVTVTLTLLSLAP